jgi:hypothetical protein
MLIPKSYLTTPKPPDWYYDYGKTMTHTSEVFDHIETERLMAAKASIERILPSWVRQNHNIVVAGGCWASELQSEYYKDVDVFILDCPNSEKEAFRILIQDSYGDAKNKTEDYVRNNDKVDEVWTSKRNLIQFIFTKHQTRNDLINDFDYVHCKTSYSENKLYITRKIYDAIIKKHLIVQNSKNIQEWRQQKFRDRGYTGVFKEEEAPTLGDILYRALSNNAKIVAKGGGGGYAVPTTWIDEWQD